MVFSRAAVLGAFAVAQADVVSKVAEWSISEVATLNVAEDLPGLPGKSLVGTTFGPFGKDNVFAVGPLSNKGAANVTTLYNKFSWPNEVYQVPADVMANAKLNGSVLAVADGFIFPGKQTGGIHLLDVGEGLSVTMKTISTDKHAWFYHHSEWLDVDMDGIIDVIAARSIKPINPFAKTDSELVWMQNKGDGTWGETQTITNGPGVGFKVVDIDGDGKMEVVATEFFKHQQLAIYSCDEKSWASCAEKQNVLETVIDAGDGPFFQGSWVDLNGDGKKDILASAQQSKVDGKVIPGKVLAFEQPSGSWRGTWTRHLLADGYLPQPKQPTGSGAPGIAVAFVMDRSEGGKPHVVLSGDDGGLVDLLTPASQSAGDWNYTKQTLYTSEKSTSQGVNTIGSVLVADVDDSGRPELFVPSYAENKLIMFTFDEAQSAIVV